MPEIRMRGRAKGQLAMPADEPIEVAPPPPMPADPEAQRRALQVLTLAQRTADEHIASAQRQAEGIRASAQAAGEQVARDAAAHADNTRREAEKVLTDARAKGIEIAKDAQAKAAELERSAQQQYDDVVGSLETKRAALQEKIERLQQFDREYRDRLRSFMQRQLTDLDTDAPPAPAQASGQVPAPVRGVQRLSEQ